MDVTPYARLIPAPRILFDAAEQRPDHVRFVVHDGAKRAVTLREHADAVQDIAAYLVGAGLEPTRSAAIFAPNRVAWMEAALAIETARGVMVPVYASSTSEQAAYIFAHAEVQFVFVATEVLLTRVFEAWGSLGDDCRIICLDDEIDPSSARAAASRGPTLAEIDRRVLSWSRARAAGHGVWSKAVRDEWLDAIDLDAPAIMLYTSGTTGDPKGVPLTHRNLTANLCDWLEALAPKLEPGDVDLLWLPMSHVFGYGEACIGNLLGYTSHLCRPDQVLALLPEVRPQTFMSVPSYWEKIAMAAKSSSIAAATGGRLRFCLSGGAGLDRSIKERFLEEGLLIIEGYGLTETSPTLTLNRPDDFDFGTVGKPLASVALKLADDGEILARGPSVFGGYHKDREATRRAFTDDGWFLTGDVGALTDDGFLKIVDRKKDILVTAGGKNVAPANIELRFKDDAMIEHLVVFGDGRKYLVAGVWLRPDVARDDAALQQRIAAVNHRLASCETIKKFRVFEEPLTIEAGYLTPTLKIRRKKIYEAFRDRLAELYE